MPIPPTAERPQSPGEEIANTVSHALGLLATLVGVPFLISHAVRRGSTAAVVGTSVFGCTIVLLYLASTLYHALPRTRAKRVFRMLDHEAIFLFIAGTYTPFTLGVLRGVWGWSLLGIVWSLAVLGIVLNAVAAVRYRRAAHPPRPLPRGAQRGAVGPPAVPATPSWAALLSS